MIITGNNRPTLSNERSLWQTRGETGLHNCLFSRLEEVKKQMELIALVTNSTDQVGVLFNPNRELMRSHHAENRFPLFYYADAEFKKEERRETQLIIDTRTKTLIANPQNQDDYDDMKEPPLQCAIKTKWVVARTLLWFLLRAIFFVNIMIRFAFEMAVL